MKQFFISKEQQKKEQQALTPLIIHHVERFLRRFWWVILFGIGCLIAYEQGVALFQEERTILQKRLKELKSIKSEVVATNQKLKLQVNSQSDPAWIEMTLMKGLGLVPEGQTKVFFAPAEDSL